MQIHNDIQKIQGCELLGSSVYLFNSIGFPLRILQHDNPLLIDVYNPVFTNVCSGIDFGFAIALQR